ncbi:unnamed protein product [Amoebophrya sp. A120]|nr:unnamed protein product [Amoebophrya sp. A120]|eukprot:GSA120T00023842001.1
MKSRLAGGIIMKSRLAPQLDFDCHGHGGRGVIMKSRIVPPLSADTQLVIQHAGLNALCQSPDVLECRQWTRTQQGGTATASQEHQGTASTATTTNAPSSSDSTYYVSVDMKKNVGASANNGADDEDGFTIELDLPAGVFYDGRYPGIPAYQSGKYIVRSRRLRPSYVRRDPDLAQFSPIRSQRMGWADAELTLPGARTSTTTGSTAGTTGGAIDNNAPPATTAPRPINTIPIFLKFDELDFRNDDRAKDFLHNAEKISDVCHRVALGLSPLPAFPSLEKEFGNYGSSATTSSQWQPHVLAGERLRRLFRMRPVPAPAIISVIGPPGKETGCGFLTMLEKADSDNESSPSPASPTTTPAAPAGRASSPVLARRSMPLSDVLRRVKEARESAGGATTTFLQRPGAAAPAPAAARPPANTTTMLTQASTAADIDDALQALFTDTSTTDFVQQLYTELVRNLRTMDRSGFLYIDVHGLNTLVHFELVEVADSSQPRAPPVAAPVVQLRYELSLVDYKTLLYMRSAQKGFGGRDDSGLVLNNTSGRDSRLLHEKLLFEVARTAPTHSTVTSNPVLAPDLHRPRPQTVRTLFALTKLPTQWGGARGHIKNLFYPLRHSRRDPNNAGRSCKAYGDELYPWDQWAPDAVPTGPMADEPVAYDLLSGIMEDIAFGYAIVGHAFKVTRPRREDSLGRRWTGTAYESGIAA